jgi:protein O-GlcNAc transferase
MRRSAKRSALKQHHLFRVPAAKISAKANPYFTRIYEKLMSIRKKIRFCGRALFASAAYHTNMSSIRANAANNLGLVHFKQGNLAEAALCFRQALRDDPNHAEACNNLGIVYFQQNLLGDAVACFRQAVQTCPQQADFHYNLGNALSRQVQHSQAARAFQQAVRLDPTHAAAQFNLGNALRDDNRLGEALSAFEKASKLKIDFAQAHLNLGNVLKDQGRVQEAIASFRNALAINPNYAQAHSNLIHTMQFSPLHDGPDILRECRAWNQVHAEPLKKSIRPHANTMSKNRRLRIGYVSPDLYMHPVARFLLPLLKAHDRKHFEIFCYSSVGVPDVITEQCRELAHVWRPIHGLADDQVAQLVRQDRIDILVDLAMHTGNNSLLVFARKPAPVQATFMAYCGTTGLGTMDYRLTDTFLDPPGQNDDCYSEKSARLPTSMWCFQPATQEPEQATLPGQNSGEITFGCLNNFCKISDETLEAWKQILQATPTANLLLHAPAGQPRDRVRAFMEGGQISAERVRFVNRLPFAEYIRTYHRIDVALDPFPYGGATTTCDALWMGVPVVCLSGHRAVGRAGVSILSILGMTELLAQDTADYVRIATELANDLPRLSKWRSSLRNRMWDSPLMDTRRYTRGVEAVYRCMWQKWCDYTPTIASPEENLPSGCPNDDVNERSKPF